MGQTRSLLLHAVTLLPVSRYSPRMRFTLWNPQGRTCGLCWPWEQAVMMERVVGIVVADLGLDSEKNIMLLCERLCIFFSPRNDQGLWWPV